MARRKSIAAGALNVRLHPHSPDLYRRFILALHERHYKTPLRGETHGALTSADLVENNEVIFGSFSKFSKIDQEGEWFDAERFEPIAEGNAPNIDPNFYPNHKPFFYYFDVATHTFIYEKYGTHGTLSSASVLKFFRNIGKNQTFRNEFGILEADHVKDRATLERLMGLATLKRIEIEIRRPNPDQLDGGLERSILNRLESQRARKERVELVAMPGQSLEPDATTLAEAEVAIDNGKVMTHGRNEAGTSEVRSSENYPREEKTKYNPEEIGEVVAFKSLVRRFLNG